MTEWHAHQLDHMQIICTSIQTDNNASYLTTQFLTGRMPFLAAAQPTASKHCMVENQINQKT